MPETKNFIAFIIAAAGLAAFFTMSYFPGTVGGAFISSPLDFPEASDKKVILPKISGGAVPLELAARAVLARDRGSGAVLFEKNPSAALPIASLTKLMTAIVVFKNTAPDEIVEIETADTKVPLYRADLVPGEKITVRGLLEAMLISSANDAAMALARHAGGGAAQFVEKMNAESMRLQMDSSSFTNPVGFDDPAHYSTAEDLSRLVNEFLLYPPLVEIVGTKEAAISSADGKYVHHAVTTNKLLTEYQEVRGLKTGYTSEARGNLIVLVDADSPDGSQAQYYSIILGSDQREEETLKLMNWIKESYKWVLQ